MKKVVIALLALFLLVMPVSSAAPPESREQLLEGALINRYLDLVGSTLQKPFGCEKISEIKRVGDPRIPAFEFKLEVVTYGGRYGEPPYDLVTLHIRDRVDMLTLIGFEKKRNLSLEEYQKRCWWFKR
ncbi:hypothetical protein [Brevibacillus invocatus]|uniref:hypothetical protein n=1 Tax=Brevibacillus invocatus TaxID=173959 RepID=UPI00203D1B62|nr:hypothetical protein [Brevibacillus invocatus]MCM3079003.1 hypothetical protein [Brevibacillus invocatus]MCM3432066.1 hypothetical protein [Brevibacillus invocatus]